MASTCTYVNRRKPNLDTHLYNCKSRRIILNDASKSSKVFIGPEKKNGPRNFVKLKLEAFLIAARERERNFTGFG